MQYQNINGDLDDGEKCCFCHLELGYNLIGVFLFINTIAYPVVAFRKPESNSLIEIVGGVIICIW